MQIVRVCRLMSFAVALAAMPALFAGALDAAWIKGVTDKSPIDYAVGEPMTFTLSLEAARGTIPSGAYELKWTRTGDDGVKEEGTVPVDGRPFVYTTKLDRPGFVRLYATVVEKATGKEFRKASLFFDGSAGADVAKLQARVEPKDFDAFWLRQRARLERIPLRVERRVVCDSTNATVCAVEIDCAGTRPVTGYLTVPHAAKSGKRLPCQLFMHGYTYDPPHRPPADGPADRVRLDINAHGMRLPAFGADAAYYKRLACEIRTKGRGKDTYAFWEDENADPETAYFNGMVLRIMRALQYLKSLPEWNGTDLWAEGASQGGLQTIWAAGCGEGVTRAEATIPWGCDYGGELVGRNRGTWFIPWAEGLGYYDAVNFAKRIPESCRTVIPRAGLGDYICPPSGVAILWNNIPGNKEIRWVQGSTHGYVPPAEYAGRDIRRSVAPAPLRVTLTFDDALKDHLLVAAPLLEQHGWRGTFTIVTDWVGTDDSKYLSWDDVRELIRRGHEVATHTASHPSLVRLLKDGKREQARQEVARSRDAIAERTGFAPRYLFTPFGQQDEETDRLVREEGLRPADVRRYCFSERNQDDVLGVVSNEVASGCRRIDFIHHGVSAADHGGWSPFRDRASFARHLDRLAELERQGVLTVTDYDGCRSSCALKAKPWPHHGVLSLSFDDHWLGDWEKAFPVFRRFGATATFCIVGEIGTNEVAFARAAQGQGHEIALHGLRHANADDAVAKDGADAYWNAEIKPQLDACRAAGISVRSFAYPNCRHSLASDELLHQRGFTRLRGSLPGVPSPNPHDPGRKREAAGQVTWKPVAEADPYFIPAVDHLNERLISNIVIGRYYHTDMDDILRAMARLGERAERLSVVSHGLSEEANGISMQTEWLVRMLAAADRLGVVVHGLR